MYRNHVAQNKKCISVIVIYYFDFANFYAYFYCFKLKKRKNQHIKVKTQKYNKLLERLKGQCCRLDCRIKLTLLVLKHAATLRFSGSLFSSFSFSAYYLNPNVNWN